MSAPHVDDDRRWWLDDPRNVRRIVFGLIACCALAFLASALYEPHGGFGAQGWFGFYGIYGFVACVALVMIAKAMRRVLMRPETYYDDGH